MPLSDCIDGFVRSGAMTKRRGEQLLRDAEGMSDDQFLKTLVDSARDSKRLTKLQSVVFNQAVKDAESHPGGFGEGVRALLVRDPNEKAGFSNVDSRRHAVLADLHAGIAEPIEKYRPKNLGFSREVTGMRKIVLELHGEATGDPDAKAYAGMIADAFEVARLRHNVAGATIPKRKDFALPHRHNAAAIAGGTSDEFKQFIMPLISRERTLTSQGTRMGNKQLDDVLKSLYDSSVEAAKATGTPTPRNLPGSRLDHRLLTFKNAEAFLTYNDRFGEANLFKLITDHLDDMAGTISLLERLGPRPEATFNQLKARAIKEGTKGGVMRDITRSFEVVTGRVDQTENVKVANVGAAVRSTLAAAQLGSAFLASLPGDLVTTFITARYMKMPFFKILNRMLTITPKNREASRILGVRIGLAAEAATSGGVAASRIGDLGPNRIAQRISDVVLRLSLLTPQTNMMRRSFGIELNAFVADHFGRAFKDLTPELQRGFGRVGIDAERWAIIRASELLDVDGAKFIDPQAISRVAAKGIKRTAKALRGAAEDVEAEMKIRGQRTGALRRRLQLVDASGRSLQGELGIVVDAQTKLLEFFRQEVDSAVIVPDARIRGMMTAGAQRGSIVGELARSIGLYKSFPVSLMSLHVRRAFNQQGRLNKATSLAQLFLLLTGAGALTVQARNLVKGRDPQPMDNKEFWSAALLAGGSLGLYADFLFSEQNRFGGGLAETAVGPVGGAIGDLTRLTMGNVQQAARGQDARFTPELIRLASRYLPGNNLFYSRLAFQRLLVNQLQLAADPRAQRSFNRSERRLTRQFGIGQWWKPGQLTPSRGPDIGAAVGE